jgi:hypothetical protein
MNSIWACVILCEVFFMTEHNFQGKKKEYSIKNFEFKGRV